MADNEPKAEPEVQEDDWNLPLDFHMFAKHEKHAIRLSGSQSFQIECVEALTPLDMMNLSSGTHDATGHCVWMGAFLLITSMDHLSSAFYGKRVLELGSGTGIAGIALLLSESVAPSFVAFTDADPDALTLCRRNCESTLDKEQEDDKEPSYQVEELMWGEPLPPSVHAASFDTILATDVLYDIGLLPPLFTTAGECVKPGGRFVLAHVPRACFNTENPPVESLEEHIVQQAVGFGFELESILRPKALSQKQKSVPIKDALNDASVQESQKQKSVPIKDALNDVSVQELEEVGAAIFTFQKKP